MPGGQGGTGTALGPSTGPAGKATWPPCPGASERVAGEGLTLGLSSRLPGDLETPVMQARGGTWGADAPQKQPSGLPQALLGPHFRGYFAMPPRTAFTNTPWKHSTPATKLSGRKPLAELRLITAQTVERVNRRLALGPGDTASGAAPD